MTALTEYQRLEATGIWYPAPDGQRRDVVVGLGDASLTITDHRDTALAHWSLAAIERVNPGRHPAVYGPAADAPERVEIDDDTMVKAIEKVRRAVERTRPHPGRLRSRLVAIAVAGSVAAAIFWLPGALVRYTASILPEASRAALGQSLRDDLTRVSGAPCNAPLGAQALGALVDRLSPHVLPQLNVVPGGVRETAHLPGGILLMNRAIVEDHESPDVVAGYLLAETERAVQMDPVLELLQHAGIGAALKLLTTGTMPDQVLAAYAEHLLTAEQAPLDLLALLPRFAAAGIPATPYAYAVDISGEATITLIEADPVPVSAAAPLISDDQWVALQNICGG
ncbi:MAG: hypothetical protein AAFY80_03655 [Pseudomonadota bacterium]